MHFEKQKLAPFLKDGIKVGLTQLRLNPRRFGDRWREVLEEIVRRVG
jgi:hypothetical protein